MEPLDYVDRRAELEAARAYVADAQDRLTPRPAPETDTVGDSVAAARVALRNADTALVRALWALDRTGRTARAVVSRRKDPAK